MSQPITSVLANDNFQIWFNTTNQLANAVSTIAVTVNSHANGGLTTGNGFVEGTFGARNLVGNTIHGGTVATPAVLTLTSNLAVIGNTVTVGNVVINSTGIAVAGVLLEAGGATFAANTSGTSAQLIDYFDKIIYRSAEYLINIKDNNANAYQVSKVLVIHDGASTNAAMMEYAIVYSNTAQGVISANANSTHILVYLAPVSTNTAVKGTKLLVVV
jgi:hypothetical protein